MGGMTFLANNPEAIMECLSNPIPVDAYIFLEDNLVNYYRQDQNISLAAQNFLARMWKIQSDIQNLKLILLHHRRGIRLVESNLELVSTPILESWTGAGDIDLYRETIAMLRRRFVTFRIQFQKRTRVLIRKLRAFERCLPNNPSFYDSIGVKKYDIKARIGELHNMLFRRFNLYFAGEAFEDELYEMHLSFLADSIKKQELWNMGTPTVPALEAIGLDFVATLFRVVDL